MITIGNRIFTEVTRPDPKVVEMFRGLPSSNINDEMNRLYCMHDYMKLLNPGTAKPLLGTAITVKAPIGDNLFFHQALDMAQPGDIIVVDGCLRDLDGIETLDMPIYAKGITPQGPWKFGPGEVNVPIACGGQVVFPGDILVGDKDGIVVVRRQDAEAVAEVAIKKKASEDKTFELMKSDLAAYSQKHLATTAKRMEGKNPATFGSYADEYRL